MCGGTGFRPGLPPDSGAGTISGNMKSGWREGASLPHFLDSPPWTSFCVWRHRPSWCRHVRWIDRKRERKNSASLPNGACAVCLYCASVAILDTYCEQKKNTRIQNAERERDWASAMSADRRPDHCLQRGTNHRTTAGLFVVENFITADALVCLCFQLMLFFTSICAYWVRHAYFGAQVFFFDYYYWFLPGKVCM